MLDLAKLGWLDDSNGSVKDFVGKTWGECILTNAESLSPRTRAFVETFANSRIDDSAPSRLDALCEVFKTVLKMNPGDRDLVVMEHRFQFSDGSKLSSTLLEFGTEHSTAMSRTVGITAATGVCLLLEGKHPGPGIHIPTAPWVFDESLRCLEAERIRFVETRS
jgi:hypothetical protein